GVKTRSSLNGGAANFNELRFEDKKGSEEVYFHAEKDFNRVVENNDTLKVGSSQADDGSQTIEIWKDRTTTIKTANEALTVEKGNQTLKVSQGNQTIEVTTGNRELKVSTGKETVTINGNQSITIQTGNHTLDISAGSSTITAAQSITLKVGGSSIVIDN